MKDGEWSRSRFWLCHFLYNRHTRDNMGACQSQPSDAMLAASLANLIAAAPSHHPKDEQRFVDRCADVCADDPAYVQSVRLLAKEQSYHRQLLSDITKKDTVPGWPARVIRRATVVMRRALTVRFELSVILTWQLIAMTFFRAARAETTSEALGRTLDQILGDVRSHAACHSERLTLEFADFNFIRRNFRRARLRLMFIAALAWACVAHRDLLWAANVTSIAFCRLAWATFTENLERMVPYRRDALLAALLEQREQPYEQPTLSDV